MPADKVTLKIPRPLYDRIKHAIAGSGFSSVNEFVVYVLRDLTADLAAGPPPLPSTRKTLPDDPGPGDSDRSPPPLPADRTVSAALTDREVEIIRERLKKLGYL